LKKAMASKQRNRTLTRPQSPRHRAARLKNLEKAWDSSRRRWEFTSARRRASLRTIKLAHRANRLLGSTERLLRRFLRMRFGRDPNFQTGHRVIDPFAGVPDSQRLELQSLITDPELFDLFDEPR
jgi:hypothetical protein